LFREPQYLLSLANQIVRLSREFSLDIVHAHYAIPHATAAYLAKQILASTPNGRVPKVVTTLHGTDITLLGSDPSYSETVAFSIDQSDGVTAVSESLKRDTYQALPIKRQIRVIPNFLECEAHSRRELPELRARLCPPDRYEKLIVHLSNFRPVKRVDSVVEIFQRVRATVRAKLILVGEGPELGRAMRMVHERRLACDVEALGEQDQVVPLLSVSDLFLLPSAQESFGLAALEAMACEVPVVASKVGGLPEVVEDGVSGFLCPPDDIDGMAKAAIDLLTDRALHEKFAKAGLLRVKRHFCADRVVPRYISFYEEIV
jgi:N-acetyl-alpha-D-glucosaminyl L-malate synthase BshA